jgi:hypothetical protein
MQNIERYCHRVINYFISVNKIEELIKYLKTSFEEEYNNDNNINVSFVNINKIKLVISKNQDEMFLLKNKYKQYFLKDTKKESELIKFVFQLVLSKYFYLY